ncbi:MAG: Chromatin structure remodeling complex protein sfh1 [Chrysothrix sp. TS-e1954]|nr:MAG: Chromatin structure remodeling complex protein sfh1 [Chrysothrix sp. TS-e1954]
MSPGRLAPDHTRAPPQAFVSTYPTRIRTYRNSLLHPVQQPATALPAPRTTKRGTTAINYAEDGYGDSDFDDDDNGSRRPTGLRSIKRDESSFDRTGQQETRYGREAFAPLDTQAIWRTWMGKLPTQTTENQNLIQTTLPLILVPIRIDLDITSFRPQRAYDPPPQAVQATLDALASPEPTPNYKLKDFFLWNLHEALTTPERFALNLFDELDLPESRRNYIVVEITKQIREQLEEYAGVALHPLFLSPNSSGAAGHTNKTQVSINGAPKTNGITNGDVGSHAQLPQLQDKHQVKTPNEHPHGITATANTASADDIDHLHNPDDAYRCIINLSLPLLNHLYTDRFEWSLLHPPGLAEHFARVTAADLGLSGEWANAIAHAIYESVLQLKRLICEDKASLLLFPGELANDALMTNTAGMTEEEEADIMALGGPTQVAAEAGWRYDPDTLGATWEPGFEVLGKDEIEKREGDRERELRRSRRDTARFSSTHAIGGDGEGGRRGARQSDYFHGGLGSNVAEDGTPAPMGRGERSKKKRRFRSLSPRGKDGTPDGQTAGYGGEESKLSEVERKDWRCKHCRTWGASGVWAVRDGPQGKRSLCHNCGWLWENEGRDKMVWSKGLFGGDTSLAVMSRDGHVYAHGSRR